jgi:hypothetical protein
VFLAAACGGGTSALAPPPTSTQSPTTTQAATTIAATTAPPTTGQAYNFFFRDFEGAWSGSVGQSSSGTPYVLVLSFSATPDATPGTARIDALSCSGSVPYLRSEQDGRYVFQLRWSPGNCVDGTIWLKPLDPRTLAYHWEDGQGHVSDTTLIRG